MLAAIPFGVSPGIAQSEIRRHVDDFDAFRELGDLAMSGAVRQPAEHDVDLAPVHLVGGDERRQIEARKMREDLRQRLAGMALGDQRGDLDRGVARGEPHHVGAGIAGGAEHRCSDGSSCWPWWRLSGSRSFRCKPESSPRLIADEVIQAIAGMTQEDRQCNGHAGFRRNDAKRSGEA